jgi:transcriptional regulator with XRE-family HTH domain
VSRNIEEKIGDLVRMRRRALGLTQAQLGRRAGLPHQIIHNIECGAVKITVERLCRISQALELPVSFFFEPSPYLEAASMQRSAERPQFIPLEDHTGP